MIPHSMTASGLLSARRELLGGQMIVVMTGCVMIPLTILVAPARLLIQQLWMLIRGNCRTLTMLNIMKMTLLNIMILTFPLLMFLKPSLNLNMTHLQYPVVRIMAINRQVTQHIMQRRSQGRGPY